MIRESIPLKGRVEIFTTRGTPRIIRGEPLTSNVPSSHQHLIGRLPVVYKDATINFDDCELLDSQDHMNIVVDGGRDNVLKSLTTGFSLVIARMAIGDKGTIPSDITVPKVPTKDRTELFNEIYRADVDTTTLTIGVPSPEVKFIKTFSALQVPITSFSNQALPYVNEVGLIMADLFIGDPLPRPDVAAPNVPDADESLFAMRCFKSVPFEAANEITITIRYTIFIE
jgi:hypothetical protein